MLNDAPRFSGKCWIAVEEQRPELIDGRFGDGWEHLGWIGTVQRDFWKALQRNFEGGRAAKWTIDFYVNAAHDSRTAQEFIKRRFDQFGELMKRDVPERFWLGVEWLTSGGHMFVTVLPATPVRPAKRAPQRQPGSRQVPGESFGVRVEADDNGTVFEHAT